MPFLKPSIISSSCHIGYSVAPSERRKGYASQMLKTALPKCKELGIDKVLITCIDNNEGSRKTILSSGGVYESSVYEPNEKVYLERYWINLSKNHFQAFRLIRLTNGRRVFLKNAS